MRDTILGEISPLCSKEELYWAQRAKENYLKHGDSNTRWFHARATVRRSINVVASLERDDGSMVDDEEDIVEMITTYFDNLFTSSGVNNVEEVLDHIDCRVNDAMNTTLCAPYHESEMWNALKMMHPNKAPGPDRLNPLFFQHSWDRCE